MRISLTTVILDEDDVPFKEKDKPLTSGVLFRRACLAEVDKTGQPVKGEDKVKRYDLYQKLTAARGAEAVDLDVEDVNLLNECVYVFGTLPMGQLRKILKNPLAETPPTPTGAP